MASPFNNGQAKKYNFSIATVAYRFNPATYLCLSWISNVVSPVKQMVPDPSLAMNQMVPDPSSAVSNSVMDIIRELITFFSAHL
jgi:hypothetical protein